MRLHLFWQVNGHNVVHACMQSNKVGITLPSSLKQDAAILRRGIHSLTRLAVRSLWIVAASVTRIGLTGFQSIVITPAIRADVVTKNVAAVIPVARNTSVFSVKTGEALRAALNHRNANSPVVLQIERSGKLMFIAFKLDNPN